MSITIRNSDLYSADFVELVKTHKALMLEQSPPESSHALLIDGLRDPNIHVWSLFDSDVLVGCGALKKLSATHGEIKAMHVLSNQRGKGLGKRMLYHLLDEARALKLERLSLETGSQTGFLAARNLYEEHGFTYCPPFGDYKDDPNSVFMTRVLT